MNTGRNSKQTTCLCRDTGGKGTLPFGLVLLYVHRGELAY